MNEIKTHATVRKDGKITVTVKLIGFNPAELESTGFMLANDTRQVYAARRMGSAIRKAVVNAYLKADPQ